jgi:hypothetical protein
MEELDQGSLHPVDRTPRGQWLILVGTYLSQMKSEWRPNRKFYLPLAYRLQNPRTNGMQGPVLEEMSQPPTDQ